ncbi:ricin-type beta-trefoil lectin domain protein [Streptomyces sclerotialus]|uniref:ricin-type beta-trefoil lectin domain protein n=1 Tax=Streptomyces sclerotialus TaxID=1957 RepID=UPI0004C9DA06
MSIWTSLEPSSATVDPGSTASVRLRLRNTGDVVDEYRFVPVGDIAPYVTVEPASVRLYPGTTGTVELTFAPPRTPDATAGPNPFGVQVIPTEHPDATTVIEGNLTITPFTEIRAEMVPHTVKGRFRGRPKLAVDNLGNTKLTASITGADRSDELSYEIRPSNVQIEPGRAAFVDAVLKPRQITWGGHKQQRPFSLAVRRSGSEPVEVDGTYVQRSVFPYWLMTVLGLLLALTITGLILWFAYKPSVTSLAQEKPQDAAATLPKETPAQPTQEPSQEPEKPAEEGQPEKPAQQEPENKPAGGGGGGDQNNGMPANTVRVLIKNWTNHTCADIPTAQGRVDGPVHQAACNSSTNDNQLWNLDKRSDDGGPNGAPLFLIRNDKDGLCMDLPDYGGARPATRVTEYKCNGTNDDNQLWWVEKKGDNRFWVRNFKSDNMCLDSQVADSDDRNLSIFPCQDEARNNHQWAFTLN